MWSLPVFTQELYFLPRYSKGNSQYPFPRETGGFSSSCVASDFVNVSIFTHLYINKIKKNTFYIKTILEFL